MPNYTSGSTRLTLEQPGLTTQQNNGSVVLDSRRTRPLWFDGRFMDARDLEREQNYFLQREADLGQAGGFESIFGLLVDQVTSSGQAVGSGMIVVHAGHGVTPAGELVAVPNDLVIRLSDLAEQQSLGVQVSASNTPPQNPETRTGLYIIALQPVEYTANPIATYPTTVQGRRSTQDGDIVEATVVTLVPYPSPPTTSAASLQQAALARQMFVTGNPGAVSDALLPLAVINLSRGAVQWIDTYLVRRDSGPQTNGVSFGLTDPSTLQAFVMQYDTQLQAAVAARQASGLKANFAATNYFLALPGMGRLPLDAIDTGSFSQVFFPQEMDVRLSIIADDELPALLQDGLSLPPIDLTLPATAYADMTVFVLIPVPRTNFAALKSSLPDTPLNPILPQVLANRSPMQLLRLYQGSVLVTPVPAVSNNAWAAAIGAQPYGFYLRRPSDPTIVPFKTPAGVVTLASSPNPSMEAQAVTFTAQVFPAGSTGNVQFMNGQTPLGTGSLSGGVATLTVPFAAVGTYTITANYSGSGPSNAPATSAPLTQTVVKAVSTVALSSSQNPSTFGQSVTLSATVAPSTATGSITFSGLGTAPLVAGVAKLTVSLAVGTYTVTAAYGGDSNTGASTSTPLTQTVTKGASSVALTSSANPATTGQAVLFTATISPSSATGSVQFRDGTTVLGAGTLSSGVATLTVSSLSAGTHTITAAYGGDDNDNASTSAALTQTINKVVSSVLLSSSVNPSSSQQIVSFTATVTPKTATGSVQFLDGTTTTATTLGTAAVSSGAATLSISTLAAGAHNITAAYVGDTNNAASTSPVLTQTVVKLTTTVALSSSQNPSTSGQAVTLTAKISPSSATGSVQFEDGGVNVGAAVPLNSGAAATTISTLSVGAHALTAAYGGDNNNAVSTSNTLTQTVNKLTAGVAVNSSLNPSTAGQTVTFTANVTPASATGTVQFQDNGANLGTAVVVSSGGATLPVSTLTAGTHSITAAYSGDASDAASTSPPFTQTVKAISSVALTSSVNPSNPQQAVTFTATVTPSSAGGSVQFQDNGTNLGSAVTLTGGVATLADSTLAAGTHSITAAYSGDANDAASTSPTFTQTVKAASTVAVSSSLNPSTAGQTVVFTANVTPASATGTVQFQDNAANLGSAVTVKSGVAMLSGSSLAAGTHSITAVYSGDTTDAASTSPPLIQTVKAVSSVVLASSVNPSNVQQAVTLTATVTPASATGSVQFQDNGTSLGSAVTVTSGIATLSVSTLPAGAHSITASYGGDSKTATSTSLALTQTVKAASSVALVSAPNPSTVGQAVALTATVTPASATGSVQFQGATSLGTGTLNASGVATLSVSTLPAGANSIIATYGGDGNTQQSASPAVTQTVKATSSVALGSSPNPSTVGQAVMFTAKVSPGGATGTVQFADSKTGSLGTGTVNTDGVASLSVSSLAVGAHSVIGTYAGDGKTAGSTSPAITQTVKTATSMKLASSPNPATEVQAVVFTAAVTPASATGSVQFSDSVLGSLGTGTLSASGVATLTYPSTPAIGGLPPGTHTITASYGGDTNNGACSATVTQIISAPPTTTTARILIP